MHLNSLPHNCNSWYKHVNSKNKNTQKRDLKIYIMYLLHLGHIRPQYFFKIRQNQRFWSNAETDYEA